MTGRNTVAVQDLRDCSAQSAWCATRTSVQAVAEGWNPAEWRTVAKTVADNTSWIAPVIPEAGDPSPFHGTPALG